MKRMTLVVLSATVLLSGCGSLTPPKYENGQYVPPPAESPLQVTLEDNVCGSSAKNRSFGTAIAGVLVPALVNQAYDRFVNWLDAKQANLSASSSGVATSTFYVANATGVPKGCLVIKRGESLEAQFSMASVGIDTPYWNMKPHMLRFSKSEAKEGTDQSKSIVAEITYAAPGADGKLVTFFQATFDLGKRVAGPKSIWTVSETGTPFVGQDSGPFLVPKSPEVAGKKLNEYGTMKVTANIIEHGQGRDWIRGVTDALREKENRDSIVKPIVDAITGKKP